MFRRLRGSAMRMMSSRRCFTKSGQKERAARKPPPLQKRGFINASKLFEHMIRARHLELAGRFDFELLAATVVDDPQIPLASVANADCLAVHRPAYGPPSCWGKE